MVAIGTTSTAVGCRRRWLPKARKEELKCIHSREVYEEADVEQCYAETSRPPTSLRWVDTNMGTEKPRIRSRLVVRELRCETQHMEAAELFSAMPPLEALILMVSILVERHRIMWGGKLAMYDISRAHFCGVAKRNVFVALPEEEAKPGQCALFESALCTAHVTQQPRGRTTTSNIWNRGVTFAGSSCPSIFRGTGDDETAGRRRDRRARPW